MKKILPLLFSAFLGYSVPSFAGQTKDLENLPSLDEAIISVLVERGQQPNNIYSAFWDSNNINPFLNISSIERYMFDCSDFIFPVKGKILSRFGSRSGRMHTGLDIKLQLGDTVVAVQSGRVRFAKYYYGYGNMVIVRHNNGVETLYSHLSKICVTVDQELKVGDLVGLGGSTGRATCTHLHFEVRVLGRPVNPELFYDFNTFELKAPRYATLKGLSAIKPMTSPLRSSAPKSVVPSAGPNQIIAKVPEGKEAVYVSEVKEDNSLALESKATPVRESVPAQAQSSAQATREAIVEKPISTPKDEVKQVEKRDVSLPEYHLLKRGESLYSLSKKYKVSVDDLCEWNNLKKTNRLNAGQKLIVSMSSAAMAHESSSSAGEVQEKVVVKTEKKPIYHKIRSGDNLSTVSKKYGTSVSNICKYNDISTRTKLYAGKRLIVGYKQEVIEEKIVERQQANEPAKKSDAEQPATLAKSSEGGSKSSSTASKTTTHKRYHTVKRGDNLSEIASRYGTTVREICNLNNITSRTTLRLGQKLRYK